MLFADVIVDISLEKLDKSYQYSVPKEYEATAVIGAPVLVPFGRGNSIKKGYIVNLTDKCNFAIERIKPLQSVEDKGVVAESRIVKLAYWMKEHYGSTVYDALRTIMPVKHTIKEKVKRTICVNVDADELEKVYKDAVSRGHVAKQRLLAELIRLDELDYEFVINKIHISRTTVNSLAKSGIISVREKTDFRNPVMKGSGNDYNISLNEAQRSIADEIINEYDSSVRRTYYIHGVTGSGKTEVYMELIKHVIDLGKQAIMLIPEISLTYQTVLRFYDRFGDRISVLNSRMSAGERYDQSVRAKNGDIDIIIGPRSALFIPFDRLGLIIIDEEHEGSYKNEGIPKYHTRETAIKLAELTGASVVLGSATPSLEAYSKAVKGEYKLFTLKERARAAVLPRVSVVDMREELKNKNRTMFSMALRQAIHERLTRKEQIILFINRRGYAGFVSCRSCGFVFKCPHCDISLTKHKDNSLVCHYCGYTEQLPELCPECGSKHIAAFGVGTQKVEELVHREFPQARILRMDADTTKSREGHEEILSAFANEDADILVGTQMIVKGHDFKKVTLVGILAADLSLYAGDYRAAERTYQLLTQASGRAGRAELPGEVIIQTYRPDNFSIIAASKADYYEFYESEMAYRNLMRYPPVVNLLVILCASKKEESADYGIACLNSRLAEYIEREHLQGDIRIIGPSPAGIKKALDIYRRVIYVKCSDYDKLILLKNDLEQYTKNINSLPGCNIYYDFNPMNTY